MVVALVIGVLVPFVPVPARADANTLYVNNANFGLAGTCVPGNDAYDSTTASNNTCSLAAALTYANSHSTASVPMTVTLATGFAAYAAGRPGGMALINGSSGGSSSFMNTNAINDLASDGAWYQITAPMTVDLQNRLGTTLTGDENYTAIYINGTGITLLNASHLMIGKTSIAVSGKSSNITIAGGTMLPSDGYYTQQFLVVQNGAQNVTLKDYTIGNLWHGADGSCESAAVCFTPNGANTTWTQTVLIQNVTFTTTASTTNTTCSSSNSTGCVNNSIVFNDYANVGGLEVTGNKFLNLKKDTDSDSVVLSGELNTNIKIANLNFHNNTITDSGSCTSSGNDWCSLVFLHRVTFTGTNVIANNTFTNKTSLNQPKAIAIDNNVSTNAMSNVFVTDNYFDGFTASAIWVDQLGVVTVARNRMGPNTYSNANTTTEESAGNGSAMLAITGSGIVRTWYPTAATLSSQTGPCQLQLTLTVPTTSTPQNPVTLDLYGTDTTKAERYLGSVSGVSGTAGQTVNVTFPITQAMVGGNGGLTGYLRVQTHSNYYSQPESSQYSRVIAVPSGTCTFAAPDFTVVKRAYADANRTVELHRGDVVALGSTVYFTYELTNMDTTATTVITSVVDSDKGSTPVCTNVTLAPGATDTTSCTWQTVVTRP